MKQGNTLDSSPGPYRPVAGMYHGFATFSAFPQLPSSQAARRGRLLSSQAVSGHLTMFNYSSSSKYLKRRRFHVPPKALPGIYFPSWRSSPTEARPAPPLLWGIAGVTTTIVSSCPLMFASQRPPIPPRLGINLHSRPTTANATTSAVRRRSMPLLPCPDNKLVNHARPGAVLGPKP